MNIEPAKREGVIRMISVKGQIAGFPTQLNNVIGFLFVALHEPNGCSDVLTKVF